jgi:gliding motility-associated-like protein
MGQGILPYGDVSTKNAIVYQNPADQKVLIKSLGIAYQTYLGLGSKDCRAHVSRGYIDNTIPNTDAYSLYYGGAGEATISGADNDYINNYIDIDFKVGTIASGDSTAFTYAYILSEPDLDEALGRTDAQFETNDALYLSGSTLKACPGDRLSLSVTNASDLSWAWTPNTNIDVTIGLHANIGVGNTPVTYTATGTGVCGPRSIQLTITPDKPQPPVATANLYYCLNAAAQPLTATGTNLHWSTDPATTTGNPTAPTPSTARAGTTTYFVRQTSTTGCISDATPINILVRRPDQTTETIPVCAEKLPYTWNGISVPATGYGVATFKTTNRNGCDSTVTLNLLPSPVPSVTVIKSNDISCLNPTAKLNASAVVAGNSSGRTVFNWSPTDGLSDPNSANPVASPAQTTTYQVTATNDGGCTATTSVTVNVSPSHSYTLPNAFTPNNDGHNDCFGFRNTAAGLKMELTVYDRLGRLVFHTTNPGDCWDGAFNGKPLPAGVYVYFVKGSGGCGLIDQKGTLTLVR